MVATMTAPRQRTATFQVKKPEPVTDAQHAEVVQTFAKECVEVDFTISGLPSERKARGKVAEAIRKHVGATSRSAKTSWRMFVAAPHKDTPTDDPGVGAIKSLNTAIADLRAFRDRRTLVKSGDVGVTEDGAVKVEAGKRLIYAEDATEFYDEACVLAKRIDEAAENVVKHLDAIKANDRRHAGELWDEGEYSASVVRRVGVAKDVVTGDYLIHFGPPRDYSVLPPEIAQKAAKWAEGQMTTSIESAVDSVADTLNKALATFLGELTSRVRIDPAADHPWRAYCAHGNAEVLKTQIHEQNPEVPPGQVRVYLSYKVPPTDESTGQEALDYSADQLVKVNRWVGPIPVAEYEQQVRPQATEERKKIFPGVIEGLIAQMTALREYKAKMLGAYGDNLTGAVGGLLSTLNQMRKLGDDNASLSKRAAETLKKDDSFRQNLSEVVADTIEALAENVEQVKVVRRRIFKKKD